MISMRHVCPYCENIHLDTRYVKVSLHGKTHELPGFVCPQCGAELFLAQEIRNFLNSKSAKAAKETMARLQ